jgi:hypothetical protein
VFDDGILQRLGDDIDKLQPGADHTTLRFGAPAAPVAFQAKSIRLGGVIPCPKNRPPGWLTTLPCAHKKIFELRCPVATD